MSWANLDDLGSLPEGHVKEGNALEKKREILLQLSYFVIEFTTTARRMGRVVKCTTVLYLGNIRK